MSLYSVDSKTETGLETELVIWKLIMKVLLGNDNSLLFCGH